jgi:hypothetical protein
VPSRLPIQRNPTACWVRGLITRMLLAGELELFSPRCRRFDLGPVKGVRWVGGRISREVPPGAISGFVLGTSNPSILISPAGSGVCRRSCVAGDSLDPYPAISRPNSIDLDRPGLLPDAEGEFCQECWGAGGAAATTRFVFRLRGTQIILYRCHVHNLLLRSRWSSGQRPSGP